MKIQNLLPIHFFSLLVLVGLFWGCGDEKDDTGTQPVATTGKIQGTVRDAVTGEPLSQVMITTTPASQSVTTASDGTFTINEVIPTQYAVRAVKVGYVSASVNVQVVAGATATADILLENRQSDVTGDSINVLEFKGDYGVVPDHDDLDLSPGSFTVEAVIYPKAFSSAWNWVINHGTSNSSLDYLIGFENAYPLFSIRSRANILQGPQRLTANRWYHIAGVQDVEGGTVSLYVDGVLIKQDQLSGSGVSTSGNLFIGARESLGSGKGTEPFDGFIREVRLWNRARSAADLQQTLTTPLEGTEEGLVGYWRLSDGGGMTFADFSSYRRDGTLFGDPSWLRIPNPWK